MSGDRERHAQTARDLQVLSRWLAWATLPLIVATWLLSREKDAVVLVAFSTLTLGFTAALAVGCKVAARAYDAGFRDGREDAS